MNCFGRGLIVFFSIFLSASIVCAEDYNLSDVITAQENAMAGVEDMEQTVSVETDANGRQDTFSYNMQMKVDEQGKKKVMLTSLGQYQMQILVDEADMSVTYLMSGGGLKKVTLSANVQSQVQELMGLNSLFGSNGTVFAYGKNKGGIATDAGIEGKIDSPEIETGDQKIKVNRGKSSRDFAFVEYENKRVLRAKEQIDKQLLDAKTMNMKSDGAKKLKQSYVRHLEKNRENMIKNMTQKRTEKINMKTGTVEEQEMFNEDGKKIGWMKVKNREKIKVRHHKKMEKAAAADVDGKELEFTTESEGENITPIGKSKYRIKTTGIKVNEGVEFKWMKKKGAGK